MFVFDTNVLVHAANRDSELHDVCRARLVEAEQFAAPAFLTWSVCYEFLRLASHPHVLSAPWSAREAWAFLRHLLESRGFQMLVAGPRHGAVLAETLAELPDLRGSVMHDVHIAVLMREHGLSRICTRDRGFRRFPFLTVVDPVRPAFFWPRPARSGSRR